MKKARKDRLTVEYEELLQFQARVGLDESGNPLIEIEPRDVVEGYPPERYMITYNCKSIIKIKEDKQPIYSYKHQVEIYFGQDFLENGPSLSAITPIWHPNIDHKYPFHICYNAPDFMTPMTSVCDLIIRVGEIIQYKRYHALWIKPYPYDTEAADWVLDFAEPKGILGKAKPIDNNNLLAEMVNLYPPKPDLNGSQSEEVDDLVSDLEDSDLEKSGLKLGIFKPIQPDDDNDNGIVFGTFKNIN